MKKILLLLVAPFIFFTAQSETVTQEEADNIVLERLSQETRQYTIYAKDGVQQKMTVTTANGEIIEVNYKFWVYYISYINNAGQYIFVKQSNGNVLEVNVTSDATPKDLAEWRIVIGDGEKKITVSLMERDDYSIFDKTVILYENENYLVKTPLFYFWSNLSNLNNLFLGYDNYLSILEKIVSDAKINNLLYSSLYFEDKKDYVLAGFLINGLCYFYDKENKDNVKQVEIGYYGQNPVTGKGKRNFYINDVLFVETIESFIEYKKKDGGVIPGNIEEKIMVSLIDRDDDAIFEKTVTLYEDENYLIKTSLVHFLSNMNSIRYDDLSFLGTVISAGKTNDLLYSSSYIDKRRIDYVLAGFLESGLCHFYDKKNAKKIEQVEVEYWGYILGPLAGAGGRRFYINNVLFLEVVDWIS